MVPPAMGTTGLEAGATVARKGSCDGLASPEVALLHRDSAGFGTIIRNLVINNCADDGIFINADEVYVFGLGWLRVSGLERPPHETSPCGAGDGIRLVDTAPPS